MTTVSLWDMKGSFIYVRKRILERIHKIGSDYLMYAVRHCCCFEIALYRSDVERGKRAVNIVTKFR